jgi:dinuclear metal center YbgI/SA1388 family protein
MQNITVDTVCHWLEEIAPLSLQENYDNAGLQIGDRNWNVTGALLTLDVTEAVIDEAISKRCNLIIAHHPLLFKGLKQITGNNYVQRCVIAAIRNNIAIYAAHTNMDHIATGVSRKMAEKLTLQHCQVLSPRTDQLYKLITYVPLSKSDAVRDALFEAGAGTIGNYDACSFNVEGIGTFRANEGAHPFVGNLHERHHEKEMRIEVIVSAFQRATIEKALIESHPYEEPAYDWMPLRNRSSQFGLGIVGTLAEPETEKAFLQRLKETFHLSMIRHTPFREKPIQKVSLCGGSGASLLQTALETKADIYISADFKYHEFFDADNRIVIADIGHYESEQFTKELLQEQLQKKMPTFALHLATSLTNPVHYF